MTLRPAARARVANSPSTYLNVNSEIAGMFDRNTSTAEPDRLDVRAARDLALAVGFDEPHGRGGEARQQRGGRLGAEGARVGDDAGERRGRRHQRRAEI